MWSISFRNNNLKGSDLPWFPFIEWVYVGIGLVLNSALRYIISPGLKCCPAMLHMKFFPVYWMSICGNWFGPQFSSQIHNFAWIKMLSCDASYGVFSVHNTNAHQTNMVSFNPFESKVVFFSLLCPLEEKDNEGQRPYNIFLVMYEPVHIIYSQ